MVFLAEPFDPVGGFYMSMLQTIHPVDSIMQGRTQETQLCCMGLLWAGVGGGGGGVGADKKII